MLKRRFNYGYVKGDKIILSQLNDLTATHTHARTRTQRDDEEYVSLCVCFERVCVSVAAVIWNRLTVAIKEVHIKLSQAIYSVNNRLCPTVTFDSGNKFQIYVDKTYADHPAPCVSS